MDKRCSIITSVLLNIRQSITSSRPLPEFKNVNKCVVCVLNIEVLHTREYRQARNTPLTTTSGS